MVFAGTPEELVAHATQERKQAAGRGGRANRKNAAPPLLRSHTGEALIPLFENADYVDRDRFSAEQLSQQEEGDIELEQIGRDTLLPWQSDGRRWHTRDSVDRAGQAIRWDRQILIKLIERIEDIDGFAPTNWENRSIVEVCGPVKSRGWFLHAITAETWLLKLKFRVPRRSFSKAQLESILDLKTLNQLEDVEQYGNEPRIRAKAAGAWMELEIRPHTLDEIDTAKFWQWITDASAVFLGKTAPNLAEPESTDPKDQKPWKILKQRWHSLRKGFPPGRNVVWPAETLSVFIQAVHQAAGGGRWRWDEPTNARYVLPGHKEPWIILHTKRPEGLIAVLNGPKGFDLAILRETAAVDMHVTSRGADAEQIQIAFTELQQPRDAAVRKLLASHMKHVSRIQV